MAGKLRGGDKGNDASKQRGARRGEKTREDLYMHGGRGQDGGGKGSEASNRRGSRQRQKRRDGKTMEARGATPAMEGKTGKGKAWQGRAMQGKVRQEKLDRDGKARGAK